MERSVYQEASIDLVFNTNVDKILRDFSALVDPDFGEFIPHMTLLPIDVSQIHDSLHIISRLPSLEKINILGLAVVPSYEEDKLWIELQVRKTKQLIELQQFIVRELTAQDYSDSDGFRPHITVGCLSLSGANNLAFGDISSIKPLSEIIHPSFVVGRNGELGKVVEIVNSTGQ